MTDQLIILGVDEGLHYSRQTALGIRRSLAISDSSLDVRLIERQALNNQFGWSQIQKARAVVGYLMPDQVRRVQELSVPAISVSRTCDGVCPTVLPDDAAMGRIVADYLISQGHRRVAFVNYATGLKWTTRFHALKHGMERVGGNCIELEWRGEVTQRFRRGMDGVTAAVGSTDYCAQRIIEVRHDLGRHVPDDLAVVGFDNDTFLCELAEVPLSSVDPNPFRIGFRAGQMLLDLLNGRPAPEEPIRIEPLGLTARASSNMMAFEDAQLRQAMRYIEQHACDPMTIGKMMETLDVSRRTLEKRFRQVLGRTIHDEVRRVRFDEARRLLLNSGLDINAVAGRCGFSNHARFTAQFKEYFDVPPTVYREQHTPDLEHQR
ncbi:MAG: substrate-binding domain-containing protein [Phycisphaerae bacterium]